MSAKKLERLSPEQEASLSLKRAEWLGVGFSTEPADRPRFLAGLKAAYAVVGKPAPRIVIWLDSWRACNYAASVVLPRLFSQKVGAQVRTQVRVQVWDQVRVQVGDQVGDHVGDQVWDQVWTQVRTQVRAQVWDQVRDQVRAQVWDQVGDQVWDQVWAQVWDQVGDQVWDQVGDQVWDQVRAQVWDQVRAQVGDQVWDQVGDQVWDQVWAQVRDQVGDQVGDQVRDQVWDQETFIAPWFWNQFEAGWLSFYDTMATLGIDTSKLAGLTEMARSAGPAWLWWDVALVCERPCVLAKNARGLHREDGPAVEYRDGWGMWALNGVRVPDWLVKTPAEELDPLAFAKIENVEIRREFVRKVGIERLCEKLGSRMLDKRDDYELHLVPLGGETGDWPYLKMRNPSIGVYHMEAVARECTTVQAALNFRNGGPFELLSPLT